MTGFVDVGKLFPVKQKKTMFIFCLVTERTTMPDGIGGAFNFSCMGKKSYKRDPNKGEGIGFPFPLIYPPSLKPLKGTLRSLENPSATHKSVMCFLGGREQKQAQTLVR